MKGKMVLDLDQCTLSCDDFHVVNSVSINLYLRNNNINFVRIYFYTLYINTWVCTVSVSYTHLDVYKRQVYNKQAKYIIVFIINDRLEAISLPQIRNKQRGFVSGSKF